MPAALRRDFAHFLPINMCIFCRYLIYATIKLWATSSPDIFQWNCFWLMGEEECFHAGNGEWLWHFYSVLIPLKMLKVLSKEQLESSHEFWGDLGKQMSISISYLVFWAWSITPLPTFSQLICIKLFCVYLIHVTIMFWAMFSLKILLRARWKWLFV